MELYRDGLLDGLLDLHALAGDSLIQLPLKGQEVHVGLGLWNQVSDLERQQGDFTTEELGTCHTEQGRRICLGYESMDQH